MESGDPKPLPGNLSRVKRYALPALVARAGDQASRRFTEFFAATIRNKNTRLAYAHAVRQFFDWCDPRGFRQLDDIEPLVVAAYIEQHTRSKPTVKQHLAAIRMQFDWLVTGQIVPHNPAAAVRGPRPVVKRGKPPVHSADQAREFPDSIDLSNAVGLRDRALIGVMVYTFARVSAAVSMTVGDYFPEGKHWWIRLHERGGKEHAVPAHHSLESYLDAFLKGAGVGADRETPFFRTVDRSGFLTDRPMSRCDALRTACWWNNVGSPRNCGCNPLPSPPGRAAGVSRLVIPRGTPRRIGSHADKGGPGLVPQRGHVRIDPRTSPCKRWPGLPRRAFTPCLLEIAERPQPPRRTTANDDFEAYSAAGSMRT